MAYRQYTHCIEKSDFDGFWNFAGRTQDPVIPLFVSGALRAALWAFLGALIGAGLGSLFGPGGTVVGSAVGGAFGLSQGFIDGFCDQWLNRRLICIDHDKCALGKVAHIEFVKDKDWFEALFDNDTSLNLRFPPYQLDEFDWFASKDYPWQTMLADGFPGAKLVEEKFQDLPYQGYGALDDKPPGNHPGGRWTLHCEFEGDGMVTLCAVARWLAVLTTIAAPLLIVIGAIAGAIYFGVKTAVKAFKTCKKSCKVPIVCDAVCAVAAFFAGIAGAVGGAIVGGLAGPGATAVVLGGILSEIFDMRHDGAFADAANDPASGTIDREDCVFIAGDHVYDAGHPDGWHEIHPVKHVQKICAHPMAGELAPESPHPDCCPDINTQQDEFKSSAFHDEVQRFWDRWCSAFQTSQDPVVIDAQQYPENQWCLHPLVDGCTRRGEPRDPGILHMPTVTGGGSPIR